MIKKIIINYQNKNSNNFNYNKKHMTKIYKIVNKKFNKKTKKYFNNRKNQI